MSKQGQTKTIEYTDATWARAKKDFLNQNQKQFIDSLTIILDYLEEDERKHYDAAESDERAGHIYPHITNVRRYIEYLYQDELGVQNELENSPNVDRIAKYLVSTFWLGAEIGLGNSSTRDMSQEQYYESNKKEWIIKAECLIKAISKIETVSAGPFDANCNFQQIRAEVKERNVLLAYINRIREIAICGMPALILPSDLAEKKVFLSIVDVCDDAIQQVNTTNKEGVPTK